MKFSNQSTLSNTTKVCASHIAFCRSGYLKYSQAGFTLLELMITLGIIGMLAVFAVPQMNNIWTSYQVNSVKTNLREHIEFSRNSAIRNRETVSICSVSSTDLNDTKTNPGQLCEKNDISWRNWIIIKEGKTPTIIARGQSDNPKIDVVAKGFSQLKFLPNGNSQQINNPTMTAAVQADANAEINLSNAQNAQFTIQHPNKPKQKMSLTVNTEGVVIQDGK